MRPVSVSRADERTRSTSSGCTSAKSSCAVQRISRASPPSITGQVALRRTLSLDTSQSKTASCEPSSASFSRSRAMRALRSAFCCSRRTRASAHAETAAIASGPATSRAYSSGSLIVREPVIDDLHAVAHVEAGGLLVREGAGPAVLHLHDDLVGDGLVAALLDLVAGVGAARGTGDRGGRVAAAAPDLVAQDAARDAADDGPAARRFTFLLDLLQVHDRAALPARGRCRRRDGDSERGERGANRKHPDVHHADLPWGRGENRSTAFSSRRP